MRRLGSLVVLALLVVLFVAPLALAAKGYRRAGFAGVDGAGIILMPETIQLYELTAGGKLEPHAEWTRSARDAIGGALVDELHAMGIAVVRYSGPGDDLERRRLHRQVGLLHAAVLQTIQAHYLQEKNRLPSMGDRFDWSLGPDAAVLAEAGAGFALWTTFGDAYSTGGRQALNVMAAVFGGPMISGRQVVLGALVDLHTGDVVWLGRRAVAGAGVADLRTAEGARHAVKDLLEGLRQ